VRHGGAADRRANRDSKPALCEAAAAKKPRAIIISASVRTESALKTAGYATGAASRSARLHTFLSSFDVIFVNLHI
jgi:hypothetical protein